MIAQSHDPATCRGCDHCRVEQVLSDTGGWEWIDNGRKTPIEPGRCWCWYVVDAAVLVLALATVWLAFRGAFQ